MTDEDDTGGHVGDDVDAGDDGDRIVLRASAGRWLWVLIGSMVFVAFGLGMAFSTETGGIAKGIGWFVAVLFGFCAIVALRQLVNPGSMTISRTSIDVIRRGRLTTFLLADCGRFMTWRNPSRGSTMVVFDYAPDGDTETHTLNRQLMGGSRSFPESYGLSAQALADLLNQARAAGIAGAAGSSGSESADNDDE